ncbi:MAG TPA: hypothetical protein VF796_13845 [Humisphaera sp.]
MVWTALVALAVPGLTSWLIRGRAGAATFVLLTGGVVAAFLFFGPLWGEVLFAGSPALQEAGLWPFLATCAGVAAASVLKGVADRRRARAAAGIG